MRGGKILRKKIIFVVLVFFIIVLSPTFNCLNLIFQERIELKKTLKKLNFDFDEFQEYLLKNKEQYQNRLLQLNKDFYTNIDYKFIPCYVREKDNLIIIFKETVDVEGLEEIESDGIIFHVVDKIPTLHAVLIEIFRKDISYIIKSFENKNDVVCAESNFFRYLSYSPNDPYWNDSWGHKLINCQDAWDLSYKLEYSWLTILDTGIDADHEDLRSANIYQWDFIENDGTADDDTNTGHGTNVTGIALARLNNKIGISGVAGDVPNIQVLKIFDASKKTSVWLILKALIYSISTNFFYDPSIICMCFGSEELSIIEKSLIDTLRFGTNKILFVAAVGNSGCSGRVDYPAGYKSVLAVGAINESGYLCRYPGFWGSNYNKNNRDVDLVAPGINIITTTDSDITSMKYGYFSGTSAATAYVAGVATLWYGARAWIKNYKQRKNEPDRCIDALLKNCKPVGDNNSYKYGNGLVDAFETLPKTRFKKGITERKYNNSLLEKIYINIFIKIFLTNDFLYRLDIIKYHTNNRKTIDILRRIGYK